MKKFRRRVSGSSWSWSVKQPLLASVCTSDCRTTQSCWEATDSGVRHKQQEIWAKAQLNGRVMLGMCKALSSFIFIIKGIWERDIQSLKRKQRGKDGKDWKRLIRVVFPLWIISFSIKLPFLFVMLFLVFPISHLKSVSQQLEMLLSGRTLSCINPWVSVSAGRNKNKNASLSDSNRPGRNS